MSRIVVKNLPAKVTDEELRQVFGAKGVITDVNRKFSKEGVFRKFAFIGYKTETEAENAKTYFNNTYVGSSKVTVELCSALGDASKPRSWSKYAKDSSNYEKKMKTVEKDEKKSKKEKTKKEKKEKVVENEEFEELKKDPQFAEFLDVNQKRGSKSICANDTGALLGTNDTKKKENVSEDEDDNDEDENEEESDSEEPKKMTDLEFLQSKMVDKEDKTNKKGVKDDNQFTIVIRNLPYKCKKPELKTFLLPLKTTSLKLPHWMKGFAYVKFKTEKEMKLALKKHKSFLRGRQVEVTMYEKKDQKPNDMTVDKKANWEKAANELKTEESIAESGRLFLRNLSYTLVEDDLKAFFSAYGPMAEVNLPIDKHTNNNKGIGFVTFVFPEHAAKAYTELDGKILQGRILHILPAKPKPNEEESENKSFKQMKKEKQKSQSGSSHNWNTLFMGGDAVANAMAQRYNTSKSDILNPESSDNVAVNLALGETQLVNETRKFLERNGVYLKAFEEINSHTERSNTIILVKNLPTDATAEELNTVFSRHGALKRVVLPPFGITAIVEFLAPSHARNAFKALAYSKFQHVPLYLEWAPVGAFNKEPEQVEKEIIEEGEEDLKESESNDVEDDYEPEDDTTLFVKNLNFETTDEVFKDHMSKCGRVHYANVSKKIDMRNSGNFLSLGFGFVQYKTKSDASKALEVLQQSRLDGHVIELKRSNRTIKSAPSSAHKKTEQTLQKSSKILVRNIPFQANKSELEKLFSTFGVLTSVRLPRRHLGSHHRGFGFVEFASRQEAKRAFDALSSSTHLYGRRLVLEWALDEETPEGDVQELRRKTVHQFQPSGKKRKIEAVLEEMRMSSHEDDTFA